MQIQFKGTNYELTDEITDFAERKFSSLKKFLGKPEKPNLFYVDLGKTTEAHQSGAVWYADVAVALDGERYYAKAESENLRAAIEKAGKELYQELRTASKKRHSVAKRSGSRLKELFRFGG